MISNIFDKIKYPLLLIALVIGSLELFAGEKMFWITIFILGFITSFLITTILSFMWFLDNNSSWTKFYTLIVLSFVIGISIGLILAKLN